MKRPSLASRKKVTAENLATLGAERLAAILESVAETRPDLKRRLRMELAAEHGAAPLIAEIDRRLGSFETSRGRVTWRQHPAFIRDLDALRELIAERLGSLDRGAAVERLWRFLATAGQVARRFRGHDEASSAVYARAAADLGRALAGSDPRLAVETLVAAMRGQPAAWVAWLPGFLAEAPQAMAEPALSLALAQPVTAPGWVTLTRMLADAAGDPDAFRDSHTAAALATPSVAAQVAERLLRAGRIEEAGDALRNAAPSPSRPQHRPDRPDFDWESAWIDYLERRSDFEAAQAARWASFERTLSPERLRDYTSRLPDFDDVEAEGRAFAHAAQHPDFERALGFLMAWPALPEAGQMILDRPDEVTAPPAEAEAWAGKLRRRQPAAAQLLLRRAAAAAFRRRDFRSCDRLTEEAESIRL
jgi:hypothetical protein